MKCVCTSTSPGSPSRSQNRRTSCPSALTSRSAAFTFEPVAVLDLGHVQGVALVPVGPPVRLRRPVLHMVAPLVDGGLVPEVGDGDPEPAGRPGGVLPEKPGDL